MDNQFFHRRLTASSMPLTHRVSGLTLILIASLLAACGGNIKTNTPQQPVKAAVGESCQDKECVDSATCNEQKVCVAKDNTGVPIGGDCTTEKRCVESGTCRNAVCVDKSTLADIGESCATTQCVDNANCENDICVSQKQCTPTGNECSSTQSCFEGKCIDKSQVCSVKNIQCKNDHYSCINGTCQPTCSATERCGGGCCASSEVCIQNQCITPPVKQEGDGDALCELNTGVAYCAEGKDCFGNPTIGYSCVPVGNYTCNIEEEILCKLNEYCAPGVNRCVKYEDNSRALCKREIPFSENIQEVITWTSGSAQVSQDYTQVMSAPMVANVYDNNKDGKLDEKDTSEIIFTSYAGDYTAQGVLRIISGEFPSTPTRPKEIFSSTSTSIPGHTPFWTSTSFSPAIADLNGDGKPDILSDAYFDEETKPFNPEADSSRNKLRDRHIVAISGSGPALGGSGDEFLFNIPIPPGKKLITWEHNPLFGVANIDGAGAPEIAIGQFLLDNQGNILCDINDAVDGRNDLMIVHLADLNGDGKQEIIASTKEYLYGKGLYVFTYHPNEASKCTIEHSLPQERISGMAIADMNADGHPELVFNAAGTVKVYDYAHKKFLWGEGINIPLPDEDKCVPPYTAPYNFYLCQRGIAVPVIADFDGDNKPEVGIAGRHFYIVIEFPDDENAAPEIKWKYRTVDTSSAKTSSSVFDFNGDGKAEVVYNDQQALRVFDGSSGDVLLRITNTNATLREYPVIADVNHDGHANIVISANSGNRGIRVFKDLHNEWVPTRQIWNQFAYHVTNINKDASVPLQEKPNWKQPWLNNFFQNVQKGNPLLVPNIRPVIKQIASSTCDDSNSTNKDIIFAIQNDGSNVVPVGKAPYKVYATNRKNQKTQTIATGVNKDVIEPSSSETVVLNSWSIPAGWSSFDVTFELNKGTEADSNSNVRELHECEYTDNSKTVSDIQLASANLVSTVSVDTSSCFGSSASLTIHYTVTNKGKRTVPKVVGNQPVTIKIYAGPIKESATLVKSINLEKNLDPGQSTEGSVEWSLPISATGLPLSVKVVADEENLILECSEEDNTVDSADTTSITCYNLG